MINLIRLKKKFLKVSEIEKECGIPDGALRRLMTKEGTLADVHIKSLEKFWIDFTRGTVEKTREGVSAKSEVSKPVVVKGNGTRPVAKKVKIGDKLINDNGTFGNGWTFTVSRATHKSGKQAEYDIVMGKKIFKRFL